MNRRSERFDFITLTPVIKKRRGPKPKTIPALLTRTEVNMRSVRLLGVSFSTLIKREDFSNSQLPLF